MAYGSAKKRYGRKDFLRASDAAKGLIRPALSKRGFSETRIIVEWDAVVGEHMGGLCRPLKLGYAAREGIGGTLTLGVTGAGALEVQHLVSQIMERVNAHYGYRAVSRIRLSQIGAEAFARHGKRSAAPQPRPEAVTRVREAVGSVRDDGLRDALEQLGRNISLRQDREASRDETKEQGSP